MGKFREIAMRIACASEEDLYELGRGINELEQGITVSQLSKIISRSVGTDINCYPGFPGNACHSFALFISLNGKLRRGRWPYNFSGILEAVIRHYQGSCCGRTRKGVVITDTWESWTYEKWQPNIDTMKRDGVYLEFYLIGKGWVTEIPI